MRITIGRKGVAAAGVALALAATAALAAGAAAHQRGPDGVRRILRQLELTGEQREAIRGVVRQHRENGQAVREQAADARRALSEAVASGADETRIRALAAELAPLRADAAVLRAGLYAGIREVLTDPQRAELDEELDEMRDRRRQRRERRESLR